MAAGDALAALKRQRPEWSPWLVVVEEVLGDVTSTEWDAAVPDPPEARGTAAPLLAGASLVVDVPAARRLMKKLVRAAARGGAPKMASLGSAFGRGADVLPLLACSVRQQEAEVAAFAAARGADVEGCRAVVALLALPVLHACRRRWEPAVPKWWSQGYCPVCGSWPAFVEIRGIERTRYARCGRCGGEWPASVLRCAYCRTTDHGELVALVPEPPGAAGAIDACTRCRGYVKAFTRLQGCAPSAVMLEDLASVELDVAALEQGFTRPPGAGWPLDIALTPRHVSRRPWAWHA